MTRTLLGIVAAAGLSLGMTTDAKAQVSLSLGNPYTGSSLFVGSGVPYGYGGYGYNSFYGAPAVGVYGAPAYGYGGYGYRPGPYRGGYGYGPRAYGGYGPRYYHRGYGGYRYGGHHRGYR